MDARDSSQPRYRVGRVGFTVMTLDSAIATVLDRHAAPAAGRPGRDVHFANAYSVAIAERDEAFARLLAEASVVFSDGVPVRWIGRRAHRTAASTWERVYGPDVMAAVFARSGPERPRHYLLGGSPDTLAALQARLGHRYPAVVIAGSESPPFRAPTADELRERDERIRQSDADIVWVGLGTPQQDFEVRRLAESLPVTALAVGAAFDFLAGTKPQAPPWMQRSGLEWTYRLGSEPRRLAWRYAWGNTVFTVAAIQTLMTARRTSRGTASGPSS